MFYQSPALLEMDVQISLSYFNWKTQLYQNYYCIGTEISTPGIGQKWQQNKEK